MEKPPTGEELSTLDETVITPISKEHGPAPVSAAVRWLRWLLQVWWS